MGAREGCKYSLPQKLQRLLEVGRDELLLLVLLKAAGPQLHCCCC